MPLTTQEIEALKKITSPSVANAIETFKVRPREQGNLSSDIRARFPEMGPMVGYAVPCVIRAEQGPIEGHRASTYGWWDFVLTIPAPRVIVVHDLDDPRGQGAQWGEVQANIHRALGCVGVVTDGSVRDLDEVRALGFQFCAAHVSVSHANVHMVDFGIPIKVGGVLIKPGDLLILQESPCEALSRYFTQTFFNFNLLWQGIHSRFATGVIDVSTPDRLSGRLGQVIVPQQ